MGVYLQTGRQNKRYNPKTESKAGRVKKKKKVQWINNQGVMVNPNPSLRVHLVARKVSLE